MGDHSGSQSNIDTGEGAPPPVLGRIEVDRFCEGCGYNLFSQGVFRDAHTQLLVCRCPECGRFHHAAGGATIAHLWLHRLALLGLWLWILVIVGVVAGLVAGQAALLVETLDALTTYVSTPGTPTPLTLPDGTVITYQSGGVTQRIADADFPHRNLYLLLVGVLAAVFGLCLGGWLAVVLHHWRRWGYLAVVAATMLGVGGAVWKTWAIAFPALANWAVPHCGCLTLAALAGGVGGVYLGRPLARLVVRMLLPPRLRISLGFLWLADGKPLPRPRAMLPAEMVGRRSP